MQLVSKEGFVFEIDNKMLKHCTELCNTNSTTVNLDEINSKIVKKVIQYCEMHQNDISIPKIQKPLQKNNIYDIVSFKDAEYITNLELEELFQIANAAQILGITTLVDLSCAYIAILIRGKNSLQVKQMFSSYKLLTDEQEQRLRDEERSTKRSPQLIFD